MFWNLIRRDNNLFFPTFPKPAKKLKKKDSLSRRQLPKENIDLKELPLTSNRPLGQLPIQEPINYFRDVIGDKLIAKNWRKTFTPLK